MNKLTRQAILWAAVAGLTAITGCRSMTSVTIPSGVTTIEDRAFADNAKLTSVIIPSGVTNIGNGAFAGCHGLTSMTIPNSVTSIGDGAFRDCRSLAAITLATASPASRIVLSEVVAG